ncbi:hypothetical protein VP01_666g1 [Puccinia sorghi]|uniref:Uncharacterized protein n=1 Tax=Puccinia sorghi TaxID=27349 RepID=A0A0L6UF03_9BASI|nr:hypothetical protein VP01_666g1 [Puccinia sorghi]
MTRNQHTGVIFYLQISLEQTALTLDICNKGYTYQDIGSHNIVAQNIQMLQFCFNMGFNIIFLPIHLVALNVCVVYICIFPWSSTGLPPCPQLANTMPTCPNFEKSKHHYIKIIMEILIKNPSEKMLEWSKYHHSTRNMNYNLQKFFAEGFSGY